MAPSNVAPPLNWKPEATFRGTFSILSACLSTLGFCVWGALHVEIVQRTRIKALLHKIGCVILAVLAPEILVILAYRQCAWASWLVQQAKIHAKAQKRSASHPTPARRGSVVMGWVTSAILLHVTTEEDEVDIETDQKGTSTGYGATNAPYRRNNPMTLTHGFYASMGGFVIDTQDSLSPDSERILPGSYGDRITLTVQGVEFLLEHEPSFIPDISQDSIMDHSKANGITKSLQLIQVSWFCINCISRRMQSLPLSLLEVYTLAHATCMLITYIIWWKKPLDVKEPSVISGGSAKEICALLLESCQLPNEDAESRAQHARTRKNLAAQARQKYGLGRTSLADRNLVTHRVRLSSWMRWSDDSDGVRLSIAYAILFAIYGGVHFIPWNDDFPTAVEKELWRIAVGVVAASGLCIGVTATVNTLLKAVERTVRFTKVVEMSINTFMFAAFGLYCIASSFLLVESFRQLLYLPPLAYQLPSWSNYWPHFA